MQRDHLLDLATKVSRARLPARSSFDCDTRIHQIGPFTIARDRRLLQPRQRWLLRPNVIPWRLAILETTIPLGQLWHVARLNINQSRRRTHQSYSTFTLGNRAAGIAHIGRRCQVEHAPGV